MGDHAAMRQGLRKTFFFFFFFFFFFLFLFFLFFFFFFEDLRIFLRPYVPRCISVRMCLRPAVSFVLHTESWIAGSQGVASLSRVFSQFCGCFRY